MRGHARAMLDAAELEAEERFRAFLGSKNPASPFPAPYLANESPIKTMLSKRTEQLESILSLQGFDDSILQGDKRKPLLCTAPYLTIYCRTTISQQNTTLTVDGSGYDESRWV